MLESPVLGLVLTIFAYQIGLIIKRYLKTDIVNPLLVATVIIIAFLKITGIPYDNYKLGGDYINFFLNPLTVALGIMLYRQRLTIKTHFISLVIGITSGVITSFLCLWFMGRLMGLDYELIYSLLPKSITTPMAISLTDILGGNASITVVMVIITGIFGAFIAPLMVKLMPFLSPIAVGVGIGTASHAVGTSKALEMGEIEGAFSSTAIALSGLITILLVPFLVKLMTLLSL